MQRSTLARTALSPLRPCGDGSLIGVVSGGRVRGERSRSHRASRPIASIRHGKSSTAPVVVGRARTVPLRPAERKPSSCDAGFRARGGNQRLRRLPRHTELRAPTTLRHQASAASARRQQDSHPSGGGARPSEALICNERPPRRFSFRKGAGGPGEDFGRRNGEDGLGRPARGPTCAQTDPADVVMGPVCHGLAPPITAFMGWSGRAAQPCR